MKSRRNFNQLTGRGLCVLAAGAILAAPAALMAAQPQSTAQTIFVAERGAFGDFLVDEKDQGVARALGMIPMRVRELPAEIPEMQMLAASLINTVLEKVSRPARVAVVANPDNPAGGAMGFGLIVSLEVKDEQDAKGLHAFVGGIIEQADIPFEPIDSQRFAGMLDIQIPVGVLSYGPRESDTGWRYELIVGSVDDADAPFKAIIRKPVAGLEPVIRGRLDLASLAPALEMVQAMAGDSPQLAMVIMQLGQTGLIGDEAIKVEFQSGYTNDASHTVTTIEGARAFAQGLSLPLESLSDADYAAIPGDSTMAFLSRVNLAQIDRTIDQMVEAGLPVEMGLEMFRQQTGVDLRADVLANIGDTMAMYLSESTGGGGLGSAVMLMSLRDKATLVQAMEKMAALGNAFAGQGARGYVRVDKWKSGNIDLFSVRFPGLPVPLELTWAFTDKWLIAGPTPQAVLVAARQTLGKGDSGLLRNAAFAKSVPGGKKLVSVSFVDNEKMMRRGYPAISMLGSALANAVRSPTDSSRDPGLVVPTFPELSRNVRPQVKFAYWQGDDFVSEGWGDRSMVVNATGLAGSASIFAPLAIIPAAAFGIAQEQGWTMDEVLFDEATRLVDLRRLINPLPEVQGAAIMLLAAPEWFDAPELKGLKDQPWFQTQQLLRYEVDSAR